MSGRTFDAAVLRRLGRIEEVRLETRPGPERPATRVTIWIVVADGEVFVRSVRGAAGLWYRNLRAYRTGVLHVGRTRITVTARPCPAERTAAVSDAYRHKYRASPYVDSVLARHTLRATLRLEPASPTTQAEPVVQGASRRRASSRRTVG